ncbi:MAG: VWA domain-containing protein, partial [Candidatus Diapherotrites archaeon]|nr:VWA domain-containing protein [Candidatus Diapherotrites archaeon]
LLIGKGPTNDITAAQSFIPASNSIRSIQLRLKRTNSSPSGDLTVSLRQTLSGANLATATITKGTLSTSYANYTVTFDSDVSLDSSLTYYIVLSTSSTSSTKYYYWAAVTPSIYSGGNAYNNSAPLSTTDAIFTTNHNARKGMQVFNVSNPRSIIHLSSIPTTDPHEVFSLGNYIYLADGTAGLKIIDVNNPLNPVLVGSLGTTNATGIYVSGNYAYIADMGGGLRIINISTKSSPSLTSTFTAPSTTYDVTGYSDGNVYLASNTYFVGVDVTNPSFPRQSVSYMTSYSYTNLAVSNNWAFNIASTNSYLITFNIYTGPKMNQVEASAKQFLDYTGWKSASDQIGLVTFASSSSLDQQLLKITDTNKVTLRNKIDAIVPGGNTAIGDGITTARTELTGTRATKGSVRFEILLSDGQSNTGSSPITAAQSAHDQNIKIYTIAYGGDADFATLQNVALITGGKYYIAGDINALQEVFEFIAIDIGESLYGGLFGVAYDSNLQMPVVNCFDFTDTNGGICSKIGDTNYLTYNIGTIDRNHTWEGHFEMNIPCSSKESCSSSRLILPFAGTKFYWKDVNLLQRTPLTWDSNVSLDFNYRDLSLTALGASVSGIGTISIDLNAKNSGILSASSTTIDFLSDDPYSGSLVGQVPINSLARSASQVLLNNRVLSNGWIYAIINRSGAIRECPGNNIVSIYCSGSLKTNFFVVDVWAWTE